MSDFNENVTTKINNMQEKVKSNDDGDVRFWVCRFSKNKNLKSHQLQQHDLEPLSLYPILQKRISY